MTIIQIQLSESSLFDDIFNNCLEVIIKKPFTGVMPDHLKYSDITIIFVFIFLKVEKIVKVFNKSYPKIFITTYNKAFILTLRFLLNHAAGRLPIFLYLLRLICKDKLTCCKGSSICVSKNNNKTILLALNFSI